MSSIRTRLKKAFPFGSKRRDLAAFGLGALIVGGAVGVLSRPGVMILALISIVILGILILGCFLTWVLGYIILLAFFDDDETVVTVEAL